ncbi:MAG TPA: ABC transporter permease, partial [Ignavibacteria bacterium]|nr:ABC transporter permease [Ignavibacteria bacterium]
MLWTNIKRILRSGFVNFWRNRVVSLTSVLIMTVTLFTLGLIIFAGSLLDSSLEQIKNKVDVNIYFNVNAKEEDIFKLKNSVENLPEVAKVNYISRDQALANFRERHKNDYLTIQALDELGENPLGASLGVKAKETSQYGSIAKFLDGQTELSQGKNPIIDKINYEQNKIAIQKLTNIINGAKKLGFVSTLFLILVSIIITFNTIRLAIYTVREEIAVMRLVGASNRYIRGPFIVEGIMYGIFSAILALILLYPTTIWLGSMSENFFGGINLFDYYINNFTQI